MLDIQEDYCNIGEIFFFRTWHSSRYFRLLITTEDIEKHSTRKIAREAEKFTID